MLIYKLTFTRQSAAGGSVACVHVPQDQRGSQMIYLADVVVFRPMRKTDSRGDKSWKSWKTDITVSKLEFFSKHLWERTGVLQEYAPLLCNEYLVSLNEAFATKWKNHSYLARKIRSNRKWNFLRFIFSSRSNLIFSHQYLLGIYSYHTLDISINLLLTIFLPLFLL